MSAVPVSKPCVALAVLLLVCRLLRLFRLVFILLFGTGQAALCSESSSSPTTITTPAKGIAEDLGCEIEGTSKSYFVDINVGTTEGNQLNSVNIVFNSASQTQVTANFKTSFTDGQTDESAFAAVSASRFRFNVNVLKLEIDTSSSFAGSAESVSRITITPESVKRMTGCEIEGGYAFAKIAKSTEQLQQVRSTMIANTGEACAIADIEKDFGAARSFSRSLTVWAPTLTNARFACMFNAYDSSGSAG